MTGLRRGRRPGGRDTRAEILSGARDLFASSGFSGTTIRGIAAAAGVDAALVHHYFGTKEDLFLAALQLPVDPRAVLAPVAAGGVDGAGARFLEIYFGVWDDPALQPGLVSVARAMLDPSSPRLLTDGFLPVVIAPLGVALGVDRPEVRMPLVASQVLGMLMMRYLLGVEPLCSMSRDRLVATYAPTIQRYLTDDLPEGC